MQSHPFLRLLVVGAGLFALGRLFFSRGEDRPQMKHTAIDPRDPAADREQGPTSVRSAGPEGMRSDDCPGWDRVDQAVDESFPASDPPAR